MIWFNITRLTILELWQNKTFKVLLAFALLSPAGALFLSSLFLVDIGKVFMDGIAGISQILAIVFLLFLVVTLLSRDIYQHVCYILLAPPVKRSDYFVGRMLGVSFAFLMLLVVLFISAAIAGWFVISEKTDFFRSGYEWYLLAQMLFFHYFQYISIIGFIFFILSWSSGDAESLLFTAAILIFSWVFPPVLKAMQDPEVASDTPAFITTMLQWLYDILPHLQGGDIALNLAHGVSIGLFETGLYILEHLAYGLVFFMLGLLIFNRRDL